MVLENGFMTLEMNELNKHFIVYNGDFISHLYIFNYLLLLILF